ncbi:MAG: hypothetical protein ACJ71F_01460 [Nitrososphaeraceae archaeon]
MLTNATVVGDAIMFVTSNKPKYKLKSSSENSDQNNELNQKQECQRKIDTGMLKILVNTLTKDIYIKWVVNADN